MISDQLSVVSESCGQRFVLRAVLGVMLLGISACMAQEQNPPVVEPSTHVAGQGSLIPEEEIEALEMPLKQRRSADSRSSIEQRRTLKSTGRKGQELVEKYPEAPNRFRVLGVIFQCQKRLLALENSEINRKAVFETCELMVKAPDEYAAERLDADLLLSEKEMSDKNATMEERAQALAGVIERYRGTTAEVKSLLRAALIVQQLDAPELENEIFDQLDERYADDHEVIAFRRDHLKVGSLSVVFEGDFEQLDGRTFSLPEDALGHLSLMVFWSKDKPGIENLLATVRKYQEQYPGRLTVFSLNVDELQDAGQSFLREQGCDWKVLRMPGGKTHPAYKTYAQGDAVAILVSEYGYAVLIPGYQTDNSGWRGERSAIFSISDARISDDRYTAQLQSLFIGDFFAGSDEGFAPGLDLAPGMQAIRDCFVQSPLRYRLKKEEALANYRKAVDLCNDVIKQHSEASGIGLVRNCRIIALMGLWKLSFDQGCLDQAVSEAKSALASELPAGADAVPRFYLAKDMLRRRDGKAESVVSGYLAACGGDQAPASALAAACLLAIEARSREMFEDYRGRFLAQHADNPAFCDFTAFLRDRHHRHRLLQPNYTRGARNHIVAHGYPSPTNDFPSIELRNLDGSTLVLPKDTNGKLTYLIFVEPPAAGSTNDFPFAIDRNGKPTRNDHLRSVMAYANDLTKRHVNGDINFVAAFLTDDADHVRYLVATNGWDCQAALVPGGLKNLMVRQFGIFSADRLPHIFLLRRDGTVAWTSSSLVYKNDFGFPFAILLGMKVQVEVCEMETAYDALAKGDYKEAVRVFSGPFLPAQPDRFGWKAPRFHGKAVSCMKLEEWGKALEAIDEAEMWHKSAHYRGREPKRLEDWPAMMAEFTMDPACDVLAELWATKAVILEQLDRNDEAAAFRKRAEAPFQEERPNVYKMFHERIKALRLNAK